MTLVKICGLSEVEHAVAAAEAGADFLGMVFADSRRRVTPERALEIVGAVKKSRQRPRTVGVFAGLSVAEVNRITGYCGLDRAQISGGEAWEYCRQVTGPLTRSLHVSPETTDTELVAAIERGTRILEEKDIIFLLDTRVGNASGGTGKTFDWSVAKKVSARFRVMVAGGLDPNNVAGLIREAHPWAVDVSSGVEIAGIKDTAKIREFVEAVKRVDAEQGDSG
jgi:phosphoribosylanthranilate isomerase